MASIQDALKQIAEDTSSDSATAPEVQVANTSNLTANSSSGV